MTYDYRHYLILRCNEIYTITPNIGNMKIIAIEMKHLMAMHNGVNIIYQHKVGEQKNINFETKKIEDDFDY